MRDRPASGTPGGRDALTDSGTSVPELGTLARRLISGGIWAFTGKFVTAGGGAAIAVLLARLLPPPEVGAYFLALTLVTATSLLARAGLEKTVLQLIAESLARGHEGRARVLIERVYLIAAITTALVGLGLALGGAHWIAESLFESPPLSRIARLAAPWMALLTFELLLAETFRGFDDIAKASVFGGAFSRATCVGFLVAILALRGQSDLQTIVLVILGCYTISLIVGGRVLWRRVRGLRSEATAKPPIQDVLSTTSPLLVANITMFTMAQAGFWILGAFRSDEEVAVYGVCARLVVLVGISLTIVAAVLPPIIGELYVQGQREKLERVIRTTTSVAAIPSVLILTAFILAGDRILGIAFGPYYANGGTILALLSLGQIINVWVGSCGYTLIMTGHQRDLMLSTILAGLVTILGSLLAVQPFGALGVAAATAGGIIVNQTTMLAFARRRCGIWTHASAPLLFETAMLLMKRLTSKTAR